MLARIKKHQAGEKGRKKVREKSGILQNVSDMFRHIFGLDLVCEIMPRTNIPVSSAFKLHGKNYQFSPKSIPGRYVNSNNLPRKEYQGRYVKTDNFPPPQVNQYTREICTKQKEWSYHPCRWFCQINKSWKYGNRREKISGSPKIVSGYISVHREISISFEKK